MMVFRQRKAPPPPPPPVGLQPREVKSGVIQSGGVTHGNWIDSWIFLLGMILTITSVVVLKFIKEGIL